jgi:hypothetical protein
MLSIEFYRSHASGNPNAYNYRPATTGLVRRVVCLPFPVLPNDDDAIINVTVANTPPSLAFARGEDPHTIRGSDMHVLDIVIRDMCKITLESITPATTQSRPHLQVKRFLTPTPHHICGLVRVGSHKCVISPLAIPMLSKGTTNINKGYVVSSTVCQATIPLESSQNNNVVRVVGVKNMGGCMRFLSRVCNVDMDKPALVYMVTLVGRLPHHPKMRMDVSLLHHVIANLLPSAPSFLDYTCEMDMEDHGITLEVKDWSKLESFVKELTKREDTTRDYIVAMAALDPISRR